VSSKENDDLPSLWTKEGFDPNACKLMKKATYNFQNPATLGKVVEVKPHGFNKTKKKNPRAGRLSRHLKSWTGFHTTAANQNLRVMKGQKGGDSTHLS